MTNRVRTLAVAAAMLLPTVSFAQDSARPFGQGSRLLSLGIMTGGDYDGFGGGASFEVGVINFTPALSLGVGGMIGYLRESEGRFSVSAMPIMAIGNVHLALPAQPKLDLYGGLSIGVVRVSSDGCDALPGIPCDDSRSDSGLGLQIGARYAMTPRASLMGQLGFSDIPLLYAGVSFKF
ncbi:MAG: outer membrane beta-barrel protein [Gemmatimonas sp.]